MLHTIWKSRVRPLVGWFVGRLVVHLHAPIRALFYFFLFFIFKLFLLGFIDVAHFLYLPLLMLAELMAGFGNNSINVL